MRRRVFGDRHRVGVEGAVLSPGAALVGRESGVCALIREALALVIDADGAGHDGHGHDDAQVIVGGRCLGPVADAGYPVHPVIDLALCARWSGYRGVLAGVNDNADRRRGRDVDATVQHAGACPDKTGQHEHQHDKNQQDTRDAAHWCDVQGRRRVEREGFFWERDSALVDARFPRHGSAGFGPLVPPSTHDAGVPDVNVAANQVAHVRVDQRGRLRGQVHVDAVVPVRLKRRNRIGHLGAAAAWAPDALGLVDDEDCTVGQLGVPVVGIHGRMGQCEPV